MTPTGYTRRALRTLASLLLLLTACAAQHRRVPPPPLPEQQWTAPAPGMSWIAGHWYWDESREEEGEREPWVWVPGHWE